MSTKAHGIRVLFLILSITLVSTSTWAAKPEHEPEDLPDPHPIPASCTYTAKGEAIEKVSIIETGVENEILILRFVGPDPDRYFMLSKLPFEPQSITEYQEFAEHPDHREAPILKLNSKSKIIGKFWKGGASLHWKLDSKDFTITCPRKGPKKEGLGGS